MTEHPNNALIVQLRTRLSERAEPLLDEMFDAVDNHTPPDVDDAYERILSLPAEDQHTVVRLLSLYAEDASAREETYAEAKRRSEQAYQILQDAADVAGLEGAQRERLTVVEALEILNVHAEPPTS